MIAKPIRKVDRALLDSVKKKPCVLCGRAPSDSSHIRSVGAGGPDTDFNVAPMCRFHHRLWHDFGPTRFMRMYPTFHFWLEGKGWDILATPFGTQLRHPSLVYNDDDQR